MAANTILLTNLSGEAYVSEPYIVLSDGSTFDGVDHDVVVAWLTAEGETQLNESLDFQSVDESNNVYISLSDLIEAYNELHGYNLKTGDD